MGSGQSWKKSLKQSEPTENQTLAHNCFATTSLLRWSQHERLTCVYQRYEGPATRKNKFMSSNLNRMTDCFDCVLTRLGVFDIDLSIAKASLFIISSHCGVQHDNLATLWIFMCKNVFLYMYAYVREWSRMIKSWRMPLPSGSRSKLESRFLFVWCLS